MKPFAKLSVSAALVSALALGSMAAHAESLTATPSANTIGVSYLLEGASTVTDVSAGLISVSGAKNFNAYCFDLLQPLAYKVDYTAQSVNNAAVSTLFNNYFAGANTNVAQAAFQVALWKIQDTQNDSYKVTSWTSANANVLALADQYVANTAAKTAGNYQLTAWQNSAKQDLIQAAPVPEPEMLSMFAAGLAVLGLVRRRKSA